MNDWQMDEYQLCYVEGGWAYFTTASLDDQWGDDWNNRPYEHNAGFPYQFSSYDEIKGEEPWDVVGFYFTSWMIEPCEGHTNSPYSVQDINVHQFGDIPWLRTAAWEVQQGRDVRIYPAAGIKEFCEKIWSLGGQVYLAPTFPFYEEIHRLWLERSN